MASRGPPAIGVAVGDRDSDRASVFCAAGHTRSESAPDHVRTGAAAWALAGPVHRSGWSGPTPEPGVAIRDPRLRPGLHTTAHSAIRRTDARLTRLSSEASLVALAPAAHNGSSAADQEQRTDDAQRDDDVRAGEGQAVLIVARRLAVRRRVIRRRTIRRRVIRVIIRRRTIRRSHPTTSHPSHPTTSRTPLRRCRPRRPRCARR